MAWTNENILEFIRLYQDERILWNPKHPNCKNRTETSDAWMRIQSFLSFGHFSIKDIKKKKESLMTSFRMHWMRKKRNPLYRPTWFAYNAMESFLCEKYSKDTKGIDIEYFDNSDETFSEDPISCPSGATETEKNTSSQNTSTTNVNKKRSKAPTNVRQLPNCSNNTKETSRTLDEYDLYGQLLVAKLRKLDEQQRDMVMHEIDNIMFRAKMQSASQTKHFAMSSSPVPRKLKSPIFIVTQENNVDYEDENNIVYPEQNGH